MFKTMNIASSIDDKMKGEETFLSDPREETFSAYFEICKIICPYILERV